MDHRRRRDALGDQPVLRHSQPGEHRGHRGRPLLLPVPRAPLSKAYTVAAGSRYTIWVNAEGETDPALAALASTEVSAAITSTAPIIVERQTYLDRDGRSFAVGHGSPGIPTAASSWFFAEGATGPAFEFSLTLVNPSASAAAVQARYRLASGELVTRDHLVPPTGRAVIVVNQEDTRLANATLSVSLESTNGVEFAAERTLRWRAPTTAAGQEAHYGAGAPATATDWGVAEGEVGGGADTDTLLTINNPAPIAATARVTLLFEDGSTVAKVLDLGASSRSTLSIAGAFPTAAEKRFSALVQSLAEIRRPGSRSSGACTSRVNGSQFLPVMDAMATPLQTPPSMVRRRRTIGCVATATAATWRCNQPRRRNCRRHTSDAAVTVTTVPAVSTPGAAAFNLQVVSDASPDLADLKRFVDSTTSRWTTQPGEGLGALLLGPHPQTADQSHRAPRLRSDRPDQELLRLRLHDVQHDHRHQPVALRSHRPQHQVLGHLQSHGVGCRVRRRVPHDRQLDVEPGHADDGSTLASVEEAAADSARLVRERSLYSTSPNGFLTGSDTCATWPT